MAEDNDYKPGAWSGHSFADAKAAYTVSAPHTYAAAVATGVKAESLVPARLTTQSTSPLVVQVDVTGSMGAWPATIFSKLPYLDIEGKEYLGPDMEISFAAVGDAYSDKFPLQAEEFGAGTVLKDKLANLKVEGGGGGSHHETYELGALYYARNVDMPNAVRPIFIFVADEAPYASVPVQKARDVCKVALAKDMTVDEVFAELKLKYSVYLVHKPYPDGGVTRREWVRLIGEDHIADLQDPERVVDVIFGILAKETGRVEYFKSEIEGRQTPVQVQTTYKALGTVHSTVDADPLAVVGGKSTMHKPTGGKATKSLI